MSAAIEAVALAKRYGGRRGLDGLDLEVREGEAFGFLGPNGAGKTTTIRLLVDLIRPSSGHVRVLGSEPREAGTDLRRRIGYLPSDFAVEGNQSARELLTYLGNLRGGVEAARPRQLAERLGLDLDVPIRSLSKGNRQKVGLIQAFMHEPDLLILDEPSSGLDPLVQRTFLDMVREARAVGQTVFMSSHVLSEVEQCADRVGIVRDGRMVAVEGLATLRARAMRHVEVRFDEPVVLAAFEGIPGVEHATVEGATLRCILTGQADALVKSLARYRVASILAFEPDLEEYFLATYRDGWSGVGGSADAA